MMRLLLPLAVVLTALWAGDLDLKPGLFLESSWAVFGLFAVLLVLSGAFSGSEIALVSLSHARVNAMLEHKLPAAHLIARLKSRPNRMLITILIGNNLVNIGASVLATAWASLAFGSQALGIVTGVLTIVVLIVGEIFPKALAQRYSDRFARVVAGPIWVLQKGLYPIVVALERLLEALLKRLGQDATRISPLGELKAFVRLVGEKRQIDGNIQDILESTFEFDETRVRDIMTPLKRLIYAEPSDTLEALRDRFVSSGKSRLPVLEKGRALGLVNMHMLLEAQNHALERVGQMTLIVPIAVDAERFIDDLLAQLQHAKQQMALVYRQGELIGVVTVENILEEIVGEMYDEKEPIFRRGFFRRQV